MQSTKSSKLMIFILLLVVIVIFTGCAGGGLINNSPTIISLTIDLASPIEVNQDTTITCYATDQDGDQLTYIWAKTGGTITGSGSTITWTAPDTAGTYVITCTVSDGNGGEDSELLNIVITESDETKITNTIYGFFQAISDLDWDMARSYCVYDSVAYNMIIDLEEGWYLDYGDIEGLEVDLIIENIDPIIIVGDDAQAHVYYYVFWYINGEPFYWDDEEEPVLLDFWLYLQKIGSNWKIYDTYTEVTPLSSEGTVK